MKRFLLLALAAPFLLAGCGIDCDKFCQKWEDCRLLAFSQEPATPGSQFVPKLSQCMTGCSATGADSSAFIACVQGKSGVDVNKGVCSIPTPAVSSTP